MHYDEFASRLPEVERRQNAETYDQIECAVNLQRSGANGRL